MKSVNHQECEFVEGFARQGAGVVVSLGSSDNDI